MTLIEMIVVITILGVLATLIVTSSIWRIGEAKQSVALTNIKTLESKVQEFYVDCGRLPNSQEGLQALVRPPSDVGTRWKGPYVKEKDILDPWGNEFIYRSPGQHNSDFDIMTFGADRQEGGEGENQDVGNWQ
ncbi:MAG: type II secretion system major pseudopilin GspG [Planctomycetes bacterium]|nr:type II secretion system major pseudopilin GspG [Planctomycetota bacterium]